MEVNGRESLEKTHNASILLSPSGMTLKGGGCLHDGESLPGKPSALDLQTLCKTPSNYQCLV